ncbi:MAG: class I SAM-dependent methyltransferase [Deltaproteobacteria bacterium]|jgi:SAM-dependent methyltransferase|nr:class I SAM-dependent methyltransferase [Deltaproteobacteria bacterium]
MPKKIWEQFRSCLKGFRGAFDSRLLAPALKKLVGWWSRPGGVLAYSFLGLMNLGHKSFLERTLRAAEIRPGGTVLDIGCGGGYALSRLAEKAEKVYGLDHSASSVGKSILLNQRKVESGQMEVRLGSVTELPFADGSFDLITAFESIYFWPEAAACLAGIYNKLKPEGFFLVACTSSAPEEGEKHFFRDADPENFHVFGRAELEEMLLSAGFSSIRSLCPEKPSWLCLMARKQGESRQDEPADGV